MLEHLQAALERLDAAMVRLTAAHAQATDAEALRCVHQMRVELQDVRIGLRMLLTRLESTSTGSR